MAELAYAAVSNTAGLTALRVRIPPRAPFVPRRSTVDLREVGGAGRTIRPMKLLLTFAAFCAFMKWRHDRLDADDRANGYGAFAPIKPEGRDLG